MVGVAQSILEKVNDTKLRQSFLGRLFDTAMLKIKDGPGFDRQRTSLPALCKPLAVHHGHSSGLDRDRGEKLHGQIPARIWNRVESTKVPRSFIRQDIS
jgi:hypothetical protein